jgi:hypothetical protein
MDKGLVRSSGVLMVGIRKDEGAWGYKGVTHNRVGGGGGLLFAIMRASS